MKRVLYIISTLKRSGPTNILYNLVNKLDRSRFQPLILTLSKEETGFPSLMKEFEGLNVEIDSLNLTRARGFLLGKRMLRKFIQDHRIDIIHINGIRGDILVRRNDYPGIPIITTINSNIYDDYTMLYGQRKGQLMSWMHIRSIKQKTIVACSNFVSKELKDRYDIGMKVIYNGIPKDLYVVSNNSKKLELRKNLGLPDSKKIFVFVGSLIYRKNPAMVIKAFLSAQCAAESHLVIVGDGPLMSECRDLLNGHTNVSLVGNKPETLPYLNASDYYISSSYSEGLPTSVMEAMGCGLPVILSGIDPHVELVSKMEKWEYLFPVNDTEILTQKLDIIVGDSYQNLSSECRLVIEDHINSNLMAEAYQELYAN